MIDLSVQPVSNVTWVDRLLLKANDYNPNRVAPAELRLLRISIVEDGWTQPIVVREDFEIVDGYHRWLVSEDIEVLALTGGQVPVVFLRDLSPEQQRMATIRHNRARGIHHVVKMADIVDSLVNDFDVAPEAIGQLLQMEDEEVSRLLDHGSMVKRGSASDFNKGWTVE